jgi:hypothetical protein
MKRLFPTIITFLIFFCITAQNIPEEKISIQTDRELYISGETVLFNFTASAKGLPAAGKTGYIVLRNAQSVPVVQLKIAIDNGNANGYLALPDTLSSGHYQLVAFTNALRNFGEEYYARRELLIVNQTDNSFNDSRETRTIHSPASNPRSNLAIQCDSAFYKPYQKVRLHINPLPSGARAVLSVFECATKADDRQSVAQTQQIENKNVTAAYPIETKAVILNGEVIDETTHEKVAGAVVLASVVDTIPNLQYAVTGSDGRFALGLSNYYDGRDVYLTVRDVPADANWKIITDDKYVLRMPFAPTPSAFPGSSFITKSQHIAYINKIYEADQYQQVAAPRIKQAPVPRFYYGTVKTLYPADYMALNNFSEIVAELFPYLSVKKHDNKARIEVIGASSKQFGYQGPAIFLDGVFVDDPNKIINLGADMIRKIDVIYAERIFGDLVFQGMIAISTKGNVIQTMRPASYSLRFRNPAVANSIWFRTQTQPPVLTVKKPFVRQLLYWNPDMAISATEGFDVEFYTSGNCGNYTVKMEGRAGNGTPVFATTDFEVKK